MRCGATGREGKIRRRASRREGNLRRWVAWKKETGAEKQVEVERNCDEYQGREENIRSWAAGEEVKISGSASERKEK
jgi:hypothetical protein